LQYILKKEPQMVTIEIAKPGKLNFVLARLQPAFAGRQVGKGED